MSTVVFNFILQVIKLAPRYLVALGAVAAFCLFVPDHILKFFDIFEFAQDYRKWFAIYLVFATALFVVCTCKFFCKLFNRIRVQRKLKHNIIKKLNSLTEEEKQILRFYILKETKSNFLRPDDGIVQGLAAYRIIYPASSMGTLLNGLSYNISTFAWDYLQKHVELIDGTTATLRTDKRYDFP